MNHLRTIPQNQVRLDAAVDHSLDPMRKRAIANAWPEIFGRPSDADLEQIPLDAMRARIRGHVAGASPLGPLETRDAAPVLERRCFAVTELRVQRDEGKPPKITGYAATFNSPSKPLSITTEDGKTRNFVETIAPGAFSRALGDGRDIAALVGHQPNHIIARTSAGKLALREDDKGLAFELTPSQTTRANDLLSDIDHGNIRGMSFGFGDDTQDEWARGADGTPQRTLKDVDLREISFTPYPAYNETSVGVRSLEAIEQLERRDHPADYSAVAEHSREMASMCRSAATQFMHTRDLLDAMSGPPNDKETRHLRDLHDALREMHRRSREVHERAKKLLSVRDADGDDPDAGDAGDAGDASRALKIAKYVRAGQLTPDQLRAVFAPPADAPAPASPPSPAPDPAK